ncbi:MAG: HEPN domain-containing protein [Verrucomicrobia bacterium]|nr:HEPN domain-containing protein [Verrucomicrobiota bacterium]
MPRKTDSRNAADWLWLAESDLSVVRLAAGQEVGFSTCRSKLAEVVEKVLKAELIRLGWKLEKTHDLNRLTGHLTDYGSDLIATATPVCKALADAYFSDRYPGFDLDDPDWPKLHAQISSVWALLEIVKSRLPST